MLYRLVGLGLGRCGREVGRGGTPSLRPLGWIETSPELEVAGVVDVDDETTAEEFNVEDDLRRKTPLLWPLVRAEDRRGSSSLMLALLFLRRLLRKEGIDNDTATVAVTATVTVYELMGRVAGACRTVETFVQAARGTRNTTTGARRTNE
jgi:hypothetical protein